MKHTILFMLAWLTMSVTYSQLVIVGFNYGNNPAVVAWDADNGVLLDSVITLSPAISVSSSAFDAAHRRYYFVGLSDIEVVDFVTGQSSTTPQWIGIQGTEFDMRDGYLYGLSANYLLDSLGNFLGYEMQYSRFNLATQTTDSLAALTGCGGISVDASAYNSNLSTYYFLGDAGQPYQELYAVPSNAPSTFTHFPLTDTAFWPQALEYDNDQDILYGLGYQGSHLQIQAIDPATGQYTLEADFPQFSAYAFSNNTYDQTSHSFVLLASDFSGNEDWYAYNTQTNQLRLLNVPAGYLEEIEADNSAYAALRYPVGRKDPEPGIELTAFPNPTSDLLHVRCAQADEAADVWLVDMVGRRTWLGELVSEAVFDLDAVPTGQYVLMVTGKSQAFCLTQPILIAR